MNTLDKERFSKILKSMAASLDIPDHVYEDALLKYEDVGAWLASDESELKPYSPEIYPQGSFRLGTVVRPIDRKDEYDIDLVCCLELKKEQTTQENLKNLVGERIKKREDLARILEPLRRCWRLNFPADGQLSHFHMDVLPTIPNPERPPTGILLTDTELTRWQKSNPKAYADWFYERMKVVLLENMSIVAKSLEAEIEDVPVWRVKTPLQIAIQTLKRHRDVYFPNDLENRPISIIITTLAARAYNNQRNVYDAIFGIVRDMPQYIENRNGQWWVANPVDPDENFADKWNKYPKRREAFFRWLQKAVADFPVGIEKFNLSEAADSFAAALNPRIGPKKTTSSGLEKALASSASILAQVAVPDLADTQHCQLSPWPLQIRYKAKIVGTVHRKDTYKKLWGLTNRPVPKNLRLKFVLTTNTPLPYLVKWQVVNTGKEASDAAGLRGGFDDSDQSNVSVKWEYTQYKGTHWIEAFVINDGMCVARSGRKFVRIR